MLIETLEGRRLLCGTTTSHVVGSPTATPAIIIAKPAIAPILGTFGGDLLTGSTADGFIASGEFKLLLSSYNSSTGALAGKLYITDLVVDGQSEGSYVVPFSGDAHVTSAGGFDVHVTGRGFDVKVKGDYKRDGTYISGTCDGTYDKGGKSIGLELSYDLKLKS
jgi:hypothetical protein